MNIEELKEKFDKDDNVAFALVFGSYAKGRNKHGSDLDIGVFYHCPPAGFDVLRQINDLSETAGVEVDLVVLNRASAFLRHQIMKKCHRLTIKDRYCYQKFRIKTIDDYQEYKYISDTGNHD